MTNAKQRRVVLTSRDVELFHWLWMLRVLTLGQLRRLGYFQLDTGRLSALDNVRKRLKRLWDAGYLDGTRLVDTKERIYVLGERALPALRERYGLDQWRLYQPKLEAESQLLHPLMVSECATRMVEAVRETDFELVSLLPSRTPFVHARMVGDSSKRRHVERFIAQENVPVTGGETPARVRPDLVCGVGKGGRARLYFFEADRDTEAPQELVEKQRAYGLYRDALDPLRPQQRLWKRYGDFGDLRVLIVTTSERRRNNLVKALRGQPGWGLMAVTTIEQLTERHPLFDPIWWNRQGKERALARG